MDNTITVKPNQSMLDVILQALGSIETGMSFCAYNNISISDTPIVGTSYKIPSTNDIQLLSDQSTLKYYGENDIVVGTLGSAPPISLGMTIVLKPFLNSMYEGGFAPPVQGYYGIIFDCTPDFTNINPLVASYPGDNKLTYEEYSAMYAGTPPTITLEIGGLPMAAKHLWYQVPWVSPQNVWVWNPHFTGQTITFEDIAGNTAIFAPVIVLIDNVPLFHEQMIASLQVDFVSSDSNTVTLRLTRSHLPPVYTNVIPPYGHMEMHWVVAGAVPYEDPANAGNPDIQLIDLTPGLHTLGVETEYIDDVTPFTFPARSLCTQVIEIA
ncbi:MAG: hypothetical protein JWQ38_191 [Flavipsychrobacter sp.]|nr:hypothetical protein [Flavipsychrobacter sp.]